jgi:hypothetical protein
MSCADERFVTASESGRVAAAELRGAAVLRHADRGIIRGIPRIVYLSTVVVGGFCVGQRPSGKLAGSLCMEATWLAPIQANRL